MDRAEDGGRAADADGEREHRDGGETARGGQAAGAITKIRKERAGGVLPAVFAHLFADRRRTPELQPGGAPGGLGRLPAGDGLFRRLIEIMLHLVGDLAVRRAVRLVSARRPRVAGAKDALTLGFTRRRAIAVAQARPVGGFGIQLLAAGAGEHLRLLPPRREFSVSRHSASSQPARSSRCRAVSSDPGFTLNTPRETCSTRRAMPKPCIGSRLRVLRIGMSRVPWMTSVVGLVHGPLDHSPGSS